MRIDPTMVSDLLFFQVAASTLSFVRAGARLSVTQSAVSQRILKLEKRLGVPLFRRRKSGLQLTSHGELLFGATEAAFGAMETAVGRLQAAVGQRPVVISCVPSLAIEWLTTRLMDLYAFHPQISVTLHAELDSTRSQALSTADFDIAIRYGPLPPRFGTIALEVPEIVFPVVSPDLKARLDRDPGLMVDLLHDALPWPDPDGDDAEWRAWIDGHGMPLPNPTRHVYSNLVQLCYRAAAEGGGVAMGRKLVVQRYLARGTLVPLATGQVLRTLKYYVVTPPGAEHPDSRRPETAIVLNWLQAKLIDDLGP